MSDEVPAIAQAVVDLLNSRAYAIHPDKLDDPALTYALLSPFGQDSPDVPPQRLDLVRGLRANLMALVDEDTAAGWAAFTERAAATTFRHDFATPGEVRLRQVAGDPVVGGITVAVASLVESETWSRVRACANDVCHEVFYDTTRSRTRRWHSYEICGNRANVAAHRARVR